MAKSSRASSKKANNQRLKASVFGPVESERQKRLSAKLLEIASAPKPVPERQMEDAEGQEESEDKKTTEKKTEDCKCKGPSPSASSPKARNVWRDRVCTKLTLFLCYSHGDRRRRQAQIQEGKDNHKETGQEVQHCLSQVCRPQDNQEKEVNGVWCWSSGFHVLIMQIIHKWCINQLIERRFISTTSTARSNA